MLGLADKRAKEIEYDLEVFQLDSKSVCDQNVDKLLINVLR